MISAIPVSVTEPRVAILDKVAAFVAASQSATAGGLTWREFGELAIALVRLLVEALDEVAGMTGEQKRAAVLAAVASLFDAVADKAVPVAAWPIWILARPAIRSLVLALAAGAIEPILQLVRS